MKLLMPFDFTTEARLKNRITELEHEYNQLRLSAKDHISGLEAENVQLKEEIEKLKEQLGQHNVAKWQYRGK